MAICDAFGAHKVTAQVQIVAPLAGLDNAQLSRGILEDEIVVRRRRVEHAEAVGVKTLVLSQ